MGRYPHLKTLIEDGTVELTASIFPEEPGYGLCEIPVPSEPFKELYGTTNFDSILDWLDEMDDTFGRMFGSAEDE